MTSGETFTTESSEKRYHCGVLSLALICLLFLIPGQSIARTRGRAARSHRTQRAQAPRTLAQLQRQIRALLNQPKFASASIGVRIATQNSGFVLFEKDSNKLLMPASNMKLYTTAAALEKLGPDYRIRTSVYALKPPDGMGNISGDLTLYGRGDPSLASRFYPGDPPQPFELLARQLAAAGVKKIGGNLIADESYLSGGPLGQGWEWMDLQWYFGAEVSALSVFDNSVEVTVRPGTKPGEPCLITVTPDVGYMNIKNFSETAAAGVTREIGMQRGLEDNSLLVWGRIPVGDTEFQARVAVHRPAGLAAALFKAALNGVGISVAGEIKIADASLNSMVRPLDVGKDKLFELAAIESPPVNELVKVVNKFSHNLYAELLLRTLGKLRGPPERDSDLAGVEVVKEVLRAAEIETSLLEICDGSGLSRRTLVNAAATTKLLSYMSRRPTGEIFQNSLPIASVDGTLARRMIGTAAANNVHAKTGTLGNTSALSGYVTTAAGEPLVFSIIINHFTADYGQALAAENEICALLASFSSRLERGH